MIFDVWTETSHLGVTVHFLDQTLLQSQCLVVRELNEEHIAEYIASIFNDILQNWNINKEKIITIVTDN